MARINATRKHATFAYDFAVDGGAESTIGMGVIIPANSVITYGFAKVVTQLTSGGSATIAVGWTGGTGVLLAATAVASWTAGTILEGVDLIVAMLEATADRELAVTIVTAALTAGRFVGYCEYVEFYE